MSKAIYDAEASVLLQATGTAAVTATAATSAVDLAWEAASTFVVVISVTDVDRGTGDETYTFSVRSLDSAGANEVAQVTIPSITETGTYYIAVDSSTAVKFDADAAKIDLNCVIAGTTPSITYSAWLNPVRGVSRP